MERKILFRGKRIENGEWVYGDLIRLDATYPWWYIMPTGASSEMYERRPYPFRENDVMCECAFAKVDPKTIGEFTGLTDKNGKEIFEGDIYHHGDRGIRYVVEYTDDCHYLGKQIGSSSWAGLNHFQKCIEIIGNIHDSPKLLEACNG